MLAIGGLCCYYAPMKKKIAIYLPPLSAVSGGFAVLIQLGNALHAAGQDVCFAARAADLPYKNTAQYVETYTKLPFVTQEELGINASFIWIVPEGWPQALLSGLQSGAHCVVYVQAWSYALNVLPGNTRWDQLPVDFIYVSAPVRLCLQHVTGKDGCIVRPAISCTPSGQSLFYTEALTDLAAPVRRIIRIAWMPRKNKVFTDLVQNAIAQRFARAYPHIAIQWVEIHRMSVERVAQTLRTCHIFFASGFPEGCPLPPLEAMASGCAVVGFGGFGGFDYMRQADFISTEPMPFLWQPWYPLRETPFGGNGLYVSDGDVMGAVHCLEHMCLLMHKGGDALATLRRNMTDTAKTYSIQSQQRDVENFLSSIKAF